jgi:hypothetical protein
MLDANKIGEILRQHFATVTPEEFEANLRRSCPEIFEEDNRLLALESDKPQQSRCFSCCQKASNPMTQLIAPLG